MESITRKEHTMLVSQQNLCLQDSKGGRLVFSPSEAETLRGLIGTIWRMTSLPAMPDEIPSGDGVFIAAIDSTGATISKITEMDGFKFSLSECDYVIDTIDMGLAKLRDIFSLRPQARPTGALSAPSGDDVWEGQGN